MWPFSSNRSEKKLTPALFLHIQKTAGTSIIELARQHYNGSLISHGDFMGHKPEEFVKTLFVTGHFGYQFAECLMPSRYSFTFLRNPAERVLSFYYFCRTRDPNELSIYQKAHDFDLVRFLRAGLEDEIVRSRIWNSQVWRLAKGPILGVDDPIVVDSPEEMLNRAISHLGNFSHIGFTETFEYDRKIILSALSIPETTKEVRVNVSENRPTADDLSPDESMALEELTALDQRLYQYAWSRRIS